MSVVIVGYARTPFSRFTGRFADIPASDLAAHAITAALARAGVDPAEVERIWGGQVLPGAAGQGPIRQAAVAAGIPLSAPAMTINAVCLSGMEAVIATARTIEAGEHSIVVAAGMESMTRAPHAFRGRAGVKYGAIEMVDTLEHDALLDSFEHRSMGASTEAGNADHGVTREAQDAWSAGSHQRAAASAAFLAEEIAPYTLTSRSGETVVTDDDGVRADTTPETLAKLRGAFSADGSITAGNSSQVTDGAAALVLMSEETAAARGITPLARIEAHAAVAGPDTRLHAQPANAILAALARLGGGATPADLAAVEINEAFAAVAVRSVDLLGIDGAIVNQHGGAIALGHPVGASGARIVGTLARQLVVAGSGSLGAAGICGGGGQGSAVILRAF
ncbi:acetyl-CoA C-acyltransferase [Pseudolysinimonas sp.]|jgi:acetyl-CoA C-acetyltransferase|uniref:acetyl-CoA C-acyltransferase n=1 Tax=Pseudolysinimonas sp. TaxID=2680009 RepID=UPI003783010D